MIGLMKHILTILVLASALWAQTDGPATLPLTVPEVRASFTPASNYPKYVGPTDSLVTALSTAVPGDTIVVDPANVTSVSKLTGPNGDCSTGRWIVVKTASALIPDEFSRILPSFAAQLPKIIITTSNGSLAPGNCVRWIGFEVTTTLPLVYNLVSLSGESNVILDRMYIHGTATTETSRGVLISDATNGSVINSYISDVHCRAVSGSCNQAQAIAGGFDSVGSGPLLIQNNYLEAAGQSILFGGGASADTPGDITIRWNDANKPMTWNPSDPTYNGGTAGSDGVKHPWVVENCMELKNAQRVLIEGNTCTGSWGGFSQVGELWTVTAKNQSTPTGNVCPNCEVVDVTIRYNEGSYASQAFQVACAPAGTGWPAACARYSIHDNAISHLQYPTCYQCGSFTNALGMGSVTVLQHVLMDNNTFMLDPAGWLNPATDPAASSANAVLVINAPPPGSSPSPIDLHFDFNVFDPGNYGLYNAGGGSTNCMSSYYPPLDLKSKVALCFPQGSVTGNQINPTETWKGPLPEIWPDGNFIAPAVAPSAGANQALINQALSHRH
jgi:hypothetical protein